MLFFYQIRSLHHSTTACPVLYCPLCGKSGGVEIGVYQKYAWAFFPMWPEHKYGTASCTHCQHSIPNQKWTDSMEQRYYQLKAQTHTPLSLWRGLIINPLLLLAFLGIVAGIVYSIAPKP